MMKPLASAYIWLFFLSTPPIIAQKDSLLSIWNNPHMADTSRLHALNGLIAQYYIKKDPDSAWVLLAQQKALAEKTGQQHYLAEYYTLAGVLHDMRGLHQQAVESHKQAVDIRMATGDKKNLARNYSNIGLAYRQLGQFAKALEFHQMALTLQTELNNKLGQASAYVGMGTVYLTQGYRSSNTEARQQANSKALEYYTKALQLSKDANDKKGINIALNNSATVLFEMGRLAESKAMHEECLQLARDQNNPAHISSSLNNLGVIHERMAEAAQTLQKRDSLQDVAMQYYRHALKIREGLSQLDLITNSLTNIAVLQHRMSENKSGAQRQKLLAEAESTALRCLALTEQSGNIIEKNHIAEALSNIYRDRGNYKAAFAAYQTFVSTRDSINSEDQRAEILKQELTFEFEKKSLETELKHQSELLEQKNQRNLFLFGIALSVVLILFLLFVIQSRKKQALKLAEKNRQVESAKEAAERSEAAKQRFLANMSHEVRTPMNAITGLSRLLLDMPHDPKTEQYLRAISHSSENLMVVLNDVLDQAKMEAGKLEIKLATFNLREELENAHRIWAAKAAGKNLHLHLHLAENLPHYIKADKARISQIIANLTGNAIKFTEHGGVTIIASAEDHKLTIRVEDTGPGISEENLPIIFESFKQLDNNQTNTSGGTGLGLSIARQLAELMGGTLVAESVQGKGSVFTLTVPLVVASSEDVSASIPLSFNASPIHVLVAEDNDYNFMVTEETLFRYFPKVNIVRAHDGMETLACVNEDDYDLILMDVQMPHLDGYETTRRLRSFGCRIPIIGLTASVLHTDLDGCLSAGMDGYIPKPFTEYEFIHTIARAHKIEGVQRQVQKGYNPERERQLFLQYIPEKIEKMKHAIDCNNFELMAKAAHLIRPQLVACNLHHLEKQCLFLETTDPHMPEYLITAKNLCKELQKTLNEWHP